MLPKSQLCKTDSVLLCMQYWIQRWPHFRTDFKIWKLKSTADHPVMPLKKTCKRLFWKESLRRSIDLCSWFILSKDSVCGICPFCAIMRMLGATLQIQQRTSKYLENIQKSPNPLISWLNYRASKVIVLTLSTSAAVKHDARLSEHLQIRGLTVEATHSSFRWRSASVPSNFQLISSPPAS